MLLVVYTNAFFHLFYEPFSIVPVNFGVGSELIVALEFLHVLIGQGEDSFKSGFEAV